MRTIVQVIAIILTINLSFGQTPQDNFEGTGNITSWFGDNCGINTGFANPFKTGLNVSNAVLRYDDTGGQYANVRFDFSPNFDLSVNHSFKIKIYVPSSGITGSQPNQVSLKLQNGSLGSPWSTQSEIIKPIVLDQWQEVLFDFKNDAYINLDSGSPAPITRTDFSRVVIQVNGENNNNHVLAYIDDLINDNSTEGAPVFDNLVWSDEFNGSGAIDAAKWHHQIHPIINGINWANNEEQHYTADASNSYRDNGSLIIKANKENYTYNGATKNYTSARINSKFAFKYGRVEVRAKLPSVAGTWPAIWLLGKNINEDGAYWDNQGFGTVGWPFCGEIDIMEPNVAKTEILGTWHWDNGGGYQSNSASIPLSNAEASQNFHIYALEWDASSMRLFVDDVLVNQMDTVNPFNQEFYIILNVAMGGNLGGTIDPAFTSDVMEIDYIRIYQESTLSSINEPNVPKVKMYPNPVDAKLNFELAGTSGKQIKMQVIDVNGRIVHDDRYLGSNNSISYNTSSLNSGLYFVKVITDDIASELLRFIKK